MLDGFEDVTGTLSMGMFFTIFFIVFNRHNKQRMPRSHRLHRVTGAAVMSFI